MKKRITALVLIVLLLLTSAIGCADSKDSAKAAAVSAEPSVTAKATPTPEISLSVVTPTPSQSLAPSETSSNAKYIFFMIGDGMGKNHRELAEKYLQYTSGNANDKLVMNTLPVTGKVKTRSLNSSITDSAASGTAYATGNRTNNGMLSVSPDGKSLETIMERAQKYGLSTGVITTTSLTDATPAAFSIHCTSRRKGLEIADKYVSSGIDFIAGGGAEHFLPKSYKGGKDTTGANLISDRKDSSNLFTDFEGKGYTAFLGADGYNSFKSYEPAAGDKVFAAFADISLPYEVDRKSQAFDSPTLAEMTQKGIDLLEKDKDGFVFMVEGARIDQASHMNDAPAALAETLAFDDAVKVAYNFYNEHPDQTLIVVLADHETGGLSLSKKVDFSVLDKLKVSQMGTLKFVYKSLKGNRVAFYKYISDNIGLKNLTSSEKNKLIKAFDLADKKKSGSEYGGNEPTSIAATSIVSARAGLKWTTFEHTSVNIPLTAIGWKSELFSGTKDNAAIGKLLFEIIEPADN